MTIRTELNCILLCRTNRLETLRTKHAHRYFYGGAPIIHEWSWCEFYYFMSILCIYKNSEIIGKGLFVVCNSMVCC